MSVCPCLSIYTSIYLSICQALHQVSRIQGLRGHTAEFRVRGRQDLKWAVGSEAELNFPWKILSVLMVWGAELYVGYS